jgi:hypothetical protein
MALNIKIMAFWIGTPCSLEETDADGEGSISSEVWVTINQDTSIISHSTVNLEMICDHITVHWIPALQRMDSAADDALSLRRCKIYGQLIS